MLSSSMIWVLEISNFVPDLLDVRWKDSSDASYRIEVYTEWWPIYYTDTIRSKWRECESVRCLAEKSSCEVHKMAMGNTCAVLTFKVFHVCNIVLQLALKVFFCFLMNHDLVICLRMVPRGIFDLGGFFTWLRDKVLATEFFWNLLSRRNMESVLHSISFLYYFPL